MKRLLLSAAIAMSLALPATADDLPTLRIAVLKFGTVNWLMETITANGLDTANGFHLETVPLAGGAATSVAFRSGDVDMIVDDWVWALYQRDHGVQIDFAPYSNTLGALMARPGITTICDLKGKSIGVVGGETDKSWIILQALATRDCGFDITQEAKILFGAPPLMSQQLESGAVDAVSTYWHFAARLEAIGMPRLMGVSEAMKQLGIDPAPPMIGFVWDSSRTDATLITAMLAAAEAGRETLSNDAAWEPLRPMMRVETDAEFDALRAAFQQGRPGPWTAADTQAARALYDLLTQLGGEGFKAEAGPFLPDIFVDPVAAPDAG